MFDSFRIDSYLQLFNVLSHSLKLIWIQLIACLLSGQKNQYMVISVGFEDVRVVSKATVVFFKDWFLGKLTVQTLDLHQWRQWYRLFRLNQALYL